MGTRSTDHAGVSEPPRMVEIGDRIFAYTQPHGGWCLNNAGVIAGDQGSVVVDTVATARRAAALRSRVLELGAGPVHTVVNTHHHGDHTFGNDAFGAVTVVAHEQARREMADTGLGLTRLWPSVDWGDVRVVLPTLTFRDRITLHIGDCRAELIHVGPAHTTNDVVVWLPRERVLFAGDVVLSGATPFNLMGSIQGALDAVARLRELSPRVIVGGHGPVGGPALFDETEAYLTWIQDVAARARGDALSPLQAAQAVGLSEFGHLIDSERVVGNLHRAYAELEGGPLGRPLDVRAVFDEMVQFNGGVLPQCRA